MVKFEKDSSLSCIYYLGSGTILGSFISGCNMKATSTRICFIDVPQMVKIWTKFDAVGAPTVNRPFPEPTDNVSKLAKGVSNNFVKTW